MRTLIGKWLAIAAVVAFSAGLMPVVAHADLSRRGASTESQKIAENIAKHEAQSACRKSNDYQLWLALNGANAGDYYINLGQTYFKQTEETAKQYGAVDFAARKEAVDMIAYGQSLLDQSIARYRTIGGKETDLVAAFKKTKKPCSDP